MGRIVKTHETSSFLSKKRRAIEPDITEWLRTHQQYALLAVPFFAFFEAFVGIGLFIPGAILLSVCTFLYIEQIATLPQMLPLAFFGALLSDHSGFYIGRSVGPRLHQTSFAQKRAKRLEKAEQTIAKYGVFAIFIGRYATPIRSIIPLVIGVSGMQRVRYSVYDIIACATWTACLGLLIVGIDAIWD